ERTELWTIGPKAGQSAVLSSVNGAPWPAIALRGDGRFAVAAVNNSLTYWELSPNRRDLDSQSWPEAIGALAFLPDQRRVLAAIRKTLRPLGPEPHEGKKTIPSPGNVKPA